jgi:hypothetical protein
MKRILIREIDRLYSKIHKDRFVSEYIVYLTENDVKLKTITVFGEKAKTTHIIALLITNDFDSTNIEENIADKIIQEINFEEVIKNQ